MPLMVSSSDGDGTKTDPRIVAQNNCEFLVRLRRNSNRMANGLKCTGMTLMSSQWIVSVLLCEKKFARSIHGLRNDFPHDSFDGFYCENSRLHHVGTMLTQARLFHDKPFDLLGLFAECFCSQMSIWNTSWSISYCGVHKSWAHPLMTSTSMSRHRWAQQSPALLEWQKTFWNNINRSMYPSSACHWIDGTGTVDDRSIYLAWLSAIMFVRNHYIVEDSREKLAANEWKKRTKKMS